MLSRFRATGVANRPLRPWSAPRNPDKGSVFPLCRSLLRDVRIVCFPWCAVAETGVKPFPIVSDLDPRGNRSDRSDTSWEHSAIHELVLQSSKE